MNCRLSGYQSAETVFGFVRVFSFVSEPATAVAQQPVGIFRSRSDRPRNGEFPNESIASARRAARSVRRSSLRLSGRTEVERIPQGPSSNSNAGQSCAQVDTIVCHPSAEHYISTTFMSYFAIKRAPLGDHLGHGGSAIEFGSCVVASTTAGASVEQMLEENRSHQFRGHPRNGPGKLAGPHEKSVVFVHFACPSFQVHLNLRLRQITSPDSPRRPLQSVLALPPWERPNGV